MQTYTVEGQTGLSFIHVGESLDMLPRYLKDRHTILIIDENISRLYGHRLPDLATITIGTSEEKKTLQTVETILRQLLAFNCDRSSLIVGIGGGITSDITGFAASVFMRGIPFGFVSTSLLSQVDASVGGKNGVNLDAFKNMIGVFSQPEFVICDIDLLKTLPKNEISNGMAEIVKHALICDAAMFEFLEKNARRALALDNEAICRLVADSVKIKSDVVQKDEKETGERRKLNFGHTIGHAIEKIERAGHGRAVAMGMTAAARFSCEKGWLSREKADRIERLLSDLDLPTEFSYPAAQIIRAAEKDKKKQGGDLHYVFLNDIGAARIEKISFDEMNRFITRHFSVPKS